MKICKCGNKVPTTSIVDGKRRNLQNRTLCLICLPFGQSRYKKKSPTEKRSYNAEKSRNWYQKAKEQNGIDPILQRRLDYKDAIIELVKSTCQICLYNRCTRNIAFHHLKNKSFSLSSREFQFSLTKLLPELKKCIVVCHNCHGEAHDELIKQTKIDKCHKDFLKVLLPLEGKTWADIKPKKKKRT
jgi:hypothetical protein